MKDNIDRVRYTASCSSKTPSKYRYYPASLAIVKAWDSLNILARGENKANYHLVKIDPGGQDIYVPVGYAYGFIDLLSKDPTIADKDIYMDGNLRFPKGRSTTKEEIMKTFSADEIREAVANYNGGCEGEKNNFLKTLGIEPKVAKRLITIEVTSGAFQGSVDVVQRELDNVLHDSDGRVIGKLCSTLADYKVVSVEDKK